MILEGSLSNTTDSRPAILSYSMAQKVAKDLVEGMAVGPKTIREFAATYLDMEAEFKRYIRQNERSRTIAACQICADGACCKGFLDKPFRRCSCNPE